MGGGVGVSRGPPAAGREGAHGGNPGQCHFLLCPPVAALLSVALPTSPPPFLALAEFDKFLEERAKAAERIPDLPSPPQEEPAAPTTNPPSKKKPERSEDALFAL